MTRQPDPIVSLEQRRKRDQRRRWLIYGIGYALYIIAVFSVSWGLARLGH